MEDLGFFFNCPDESLLEKSLNTSKGIKWEREVLLFPSFLFPRQVRSAFNQKKKSKKKKSLILRYQNCALVLSFKKKMAFEPG